MSKKRSVLIAAMLLGLASGSSANELIQNGSFEDGFFIENASNRGLPGPILQPHAMLVEKDDTSSIAHWQTVGDTIGWFEPGSVYGLSASNGNRFLDLSGWIRQSPFGGVKQTIATVVGQRYKLSFDLGYSQQYGNDATIKASAGLDPLDIRQFTIGCCNGLNKWNTFGFEFTAKAATTDIVLAEAFPSRDYVGLDNVSVQTVAAPVPEPETYAMMLAGLGLMGVAVRRRKQR